MDPLTENAGGTEAWFPSFGFRVDRGMIRSAFLAGGSCFEEAKNVASTVAKFNSVQPDPVQ